MTTPREISLYHDQLQLGIGRLLGQFKGRPNLEAVMACLVDGFSDAGGGDGVDRIEDTFADMLLLRTLESATHTQLDELAGLFKVERGTDSDDRLRLRLKAEMLVLRSSGTPEEILNIVATLEGDSASIIYRPYYPAAFVIEVLTLLVSPLDILADLVNRAQAGGCNCQVVGYTVTPIFGFFEDTDPNVSGFGDIGDASQGGWWSSVATGV